MAWTTGSILAAGRVEVQQVLLNLLVNAVRALEGVPESTRRITIAVSNGDERVTLTVADTGPGIDPEIREAYDRTYAILHRMPAAERLAFSLWLERKP